MIKSKRERWACFLIDVFIRSKFKSRFSAINYFVNEPLLLAEKSVLLLGNHITWWDGFLCWKINKDLIKKRYHVMMLESQLKKFWFFRKCGAFSINPDSRNAIESLRYAQNLLSSTSNMIQFYPQGKLNSLYDEDFAFNRGIEYLIKNNSIIIFYAAFIDFANNEKPYINVFLKPLKDNMGLTYKQLEKLYMDFYSESKKNHILQFKP